MNTTIFLAQLWGAVILTIGLGIFISRSYYLKIYRDLEKHGFAALIFGLVAMTSGIAQVIFHNIWTTLPEVIVSLLGWGMLIKGAMFIVAPKFIDKAGDEFVSLRLLSYVGVIMLLLGGYLAWFAFLS